MADETEADNVTRKEADFFSSKPDNLEHSTVTMDSSLTVTHNEPASEKLGALQQQYAESKRKILPKSINCLFLQSVLSSSFPDAKTVDTEFQATRKEVQKSKEKLQESKENVRCLIQALVSGCEEKQKQRQEEGQVLKELDAQVQSLRQKTEEIRIKTQNSVGDLSPSEALKKKLDILEELKARKLKGKELKQNIASATLVSQKAMQDQENRKMAAEKSIKDINKIASSKKSEFQRLTKKKIASWIETVVEIGGVTDVTSDENSMIVTITCKRDQNSDKKETMEVDKDWNIAEISTEKKEEDTLHLEIVFHEERIVDAKVDVDSFDICNISKEAIKRNDVCYLVYQTKTAWLQHYPVIQEMEDLRHLYALDWIHDQRIVKVLYGHGAETVCTLSIEPGYPGNGTVNLKAATGLPSEISIDQLKVPNAKPSLTEWLHFLHQKLVPQNDMDL